jgi:hypothetical protein
MEQTTQPNQYQGPEYTTDNPQGQDSVQSDVRQDVQSAASPEEYGLDMSQEIEVQNTGDALGAQVALAKESMTGFWIVFGLVLVVIAIGVWYFGRSVLRVQSAQPLEETADPLPDKSSKTAKATTKKAVKKQPPKKKKSNKGRPKRKK